MQIKTESDVRQFIRHCQEILDKNPGLRVFDVVESELRRSVEDEQCAARRERDTLIDDLTKIIINHKPII